MTKARDLANLISTGNPLADGALAVAEVTGAAPLASPTFTGTLAAPTINASTALQIGGTAITVGASDINTVTAKAPLASPTFTGDVTLADKIVHTSDTNTAIRFPANDTVAFETGGSERFRFASAGQLGIGGATYGTAGQVLSSGGSSAAPTWADAGGGAYELVSKTTISSSTSEVLLNGISAPQNQLLILIDSIKVDAIGNFMLMYRNSSNQNLDNTGGISGSYPYASVGVRADTTSTGVNSGAYSYGIFLNNSQIVANGILSGVVRIFNFGIANVNPYAMGQMTHKVGTNNDEFRYHTFGCEGVFSSGQTVAGLRFYSLNSQNMTSGKIYVYKLL
jgi:hypothetical protein